MRVFLKSPVLENGTPGSVRGASGNWRPYRDGFVQLSSKRNHLDSKTRLAVSSFVETLGETVLRVQVQKWGNRLRCEFRGPLPKMGQ